MWTALNTLEYRISCGQFTYMNILSSQNTTFLSILPSDTGPQLLIIPSDVTQYTSLFIVDLPFMLPVYFKNKKSVKTRQTMSLNCHETL